MKKTFISNYKIAGGILIFLLAVCIAKAANAENAFFFNGLSSGLPIQTDDGKIKVVVNFEGDESVRVKTKLSMTATKDEIKDYFTLKEGQNPSTDLYFVRAFPSSDGVCLGRAKVTVKYNESAYNQELYYYDWKDYSFKKMENVVNDEKNKEFNFEINDCSDITFTLFNGQEMVGLASWYVHPKYKKELMAASTIFPKGTKLKVINPANNKEVIVTVKDYGPKKCADWTAKEQRLSGPCKERIIDLSKEAFNQISNYREGVTIVKVMPFIEASTSPELDLALNKKI